MLYSIPPSEKKKAIQYLIDNIPAETLEEVAKDMRENGSDWGILHHHGFGTDVRNLLRKGGFDWGPIDLDEVWIGLVEKAVKKKFGK
jgi:hypothetical protein